MEAKSVNFKQAKGIKSAFLVILCCFILAVCIFHFVLGNPANFMNNDPNNHPLPGNMLGTIYKGGVIVPVIQTLLLTVLVLSIERAFAIGKAKGKGNVVKFVKNVKDALNGGDVEKARELCVKQKGSVASVVYSALTKYEEMEKDTTLAKDQKLMNIQKELDEATALELPTLEQNLVVIATMTTLGTLTGLLGTVIGMIKSFAALANAGSPDSVALSAGISEALVNTAFGIATGALAVISYNYFTSKIDKLTYSIDEVGFTIVQTYAATHKYSTSKLRLAIMAKVKVKRKSTFIDMTAMSDVTVLLLTFFMLTSTFIQKEPVTVTTPGSVSEIKIPESDILQILVDPQGKVFMTLDKQEDRVEVLKKVGEEYGITFTPEEINKFRLANSFGVPISQMKAFLALSEDEQDATLKELGIPTDSTDNQFKVWVKSAREQNRNLRIAIKADQTTPYPEIKTIMTSLQDIRENRYNLITSLKVVAPEE